jgi:PAS domain S-box-containing protein
VPDRPATAQAAPGQRYSRGYGFLKSFAAKGRGRAWAQPVTYLGLVMLAASYGVLAMLIANDRADAITTAKRQGENLVRIIDQSYSHLFQNVDANLLFLRKAYQQNRAGFAISEWTSDPAIHNDLTLNYVVIDATGQVTKATSIPGTQSASEMIGRDFADRPYFRDQQQATTDNLDIGRPMTMSLTGRIASVLTRRMTTPDGRFAGIVAALINPIELGRAASGIDLGAGGSVGLVGFDGIVRARVIDGRIDDAVAGLRIPPTAGILKEARRSRTGNFWNSPGLIDNFSRLVSYRVLGAYPMIATVTVTRAEILRAADAAARLYFAIALFLTAVILFAIRSGVARERKLLAATDEMAEAQTALRQSQERYALVEAAVNDGIWDWDILSDSDYRSPRWKSILGYGDDEISVSADAFRALIHPDDRATVLQAAQAHLDNDTPYNLEFRLRHKDGGYRWVHSRGKAIRDAAHRPVRMLGTMTDISDRKAAEVRAEENRANLERAEAMALLGHYKYDLASDRMTWSNGTYRIFGKTPETFTPSLDAVLQLYHPDSKTLLLQYRRDLLAGVERRTIKLRALADDGQILEIEFWAAPIRAADGSVTGMFGTVQNITSRKKAEDALERYNIELEDRVSQRTAELADEMKRREAAQMTLAQMQKMEVVGQLTAGIAHDFNNLLAVIGGSLEFVDGAAARGLTAEPELIDAALRATRRGRELVKRLLAFARQSPLRAEATTIDQLVLDTLRLLQRTLGQGIDMVTRLDAKAAVISVDRNQLANVLLNLALNARDAMPDGGQLTIATRCQPAVTGADETSPRGPTGEDVCISISDTGAGMSEEIRQRAFEPFFTTKADGLGSGLGLSMVQGFVEQSGGHIDIDSEQGRGTTVTIRLPRIAAASQADETDADTGLTASGREKTVLLVEDDPDVRIVTAAQLKQLGYKVLAVADGMEAIDLIASPATIDITLTDIVLPGGFDGVALIKEAMLARPNMGVLCMSGYDPTLKHRKWLKVQNIIFLEKPFSSSRLAQALNDALAH